MHTLFQSQKVLTSKFIQSAKNRRFFPSFLRMQHLRPLEFGSMPSHLFSLRLIFKRSTLESLRDVSVTRIGDTLSYGFPQTVINACFDSIVQRKKPAQKSNLPWSTIFSIIIYYVLSEIVKLSGINIFYVILRPLILDNNFFILKGKHLNLNIGANPMKIE